MRGRLDLPHGLHQRILHGNTDIAAAVPFAQFRQGPVILAAELTRGAADGELEHLHAGLDVREGDVDSALESATDRRVQLPGDVGRAED